MFLCCIFQFKLNRYSSPGQPVVLKHCKMSSHKATKPFSSNCSTRQPNRLANEKSPYLLQHQYNPVYWYPWCQEALDKARNERKPIFLSVGYSTCHWCHVMEHESFEDINIAQFMNENFINIKLDREVRPDIDKQYMNYVVATSGHGGWPMSVFLEPDNLLPIFGGTYFPPKGDGFGRPGFADILNILADAWAKSSEKLVSDGRSTAQRLISLFEGTSNLDNDDSILSKTALDNNDAVKTSLINKEDHVSIGTPISSINPFVLSLANFASYQSALFDPEFGGWGDAPKFPRPSIFLSLIAASFACPSKDKKILLQQCELTMLNMSRGGIHDHLAGGFHRYSVSPDWKVPHFEKMLYDQAQLIVAYLYLFQVTRNDHYAKVARMILDWVKTDLYDRETGGFYCALDADSIPTVLMQKDSHYNYASSLYCQSVDQQENTVKREGAFYVWKQDELMQCLSPEQYQVFCLIFDIRKEGNVESIYDPHGELIDTNILHQIRTIQEVAAQQHLPYSEKELESYLNQAKSILFQRRSIRSHPHLDDKILTSWNALMIQAFALAYRILGDVEDLRIARRAIEFIRQDLYLPEHGLLIRGYRNGPLDVMGFGDDYAYMIAALLDMYESTFDLNYLEWCLKLQEKMDQVFWDERRGGYFFDSKFQASQVPSDSAHLPSHYIAKSGLFMRIRESHDGAEPSNNSVAAFSLLRISHMLGRETMKKRAMQLLMANSPKLIGDTSDILSFPHMVLAAELSTRAPKTIVISGLMDHYEKSPETIPSSSRLTNQTSMEAFLKLIWSKYDPFRVMIHADHRGNQETEFASSGSPILSHTNKTSYDSPTLQICENYTCLAPITQLSDLQAYLDKQES